MLLGTEAARLRCPGLDGRTAQPVATHHFADGILGPVGDELQACDERRAKAVLSRKLDQLS